MSTNNGKGNEPLGYGHDKKGAAVGDATAQGRPNVTFAPSTKENDELIRFTLDGQ